MACLRFRQCPCCGEQKFSRVFCNPSPREIADWRQFFYGSRQFINDIYSCDSCGYRFINGIEAAYVRHYQSQDASENDRLTGFRKRYFERVKRQALKDFPSLTRVSNVMDVGCADGTWLDLWTGVPRAGVEYSPLYRQTLAGKGIHAVEPALRAEAGVFDLVTLFDVLEHLEDPLLELQKLRSSLSPRGHLILGVPDMGKLAARLLGSRYYLVCPMHFSYFTKRSLSLLISQVFPDKKVLIQSSPPMEADLQGILKWLPLGKWVPPKVNFAVPLGYSASLICIVA